MFFTGCLLSSFSEIHTTVLKSETLPAVGIFGQGRLNVDWWPVCVCVRACLLASPIYPQSCNPIQSSSWSLKSHEKILSCFRLLAAGLQTVVLSWREMRMNLPLTFLPGRTSSSPFCSSHCVCYDPGSNQEDGDWLLLLARPSVGKFEIFLLDILI